MVTPHHKVSYAQNFEDLLLAGLLKGVAAGFYVDVGANHPDNDSVTRVFYERGWRGINVEPNPVLHALLAAHRPRDINVQLGLASHPGSLRFRRFDDLDGLSTCSSETKRAFAEYRPQARYTDFDIGVTSLNELLLEHRPQGDIHFLKIDVEGLELEVLLGNDWARFRPWVLCLERNLSSARQAAINALLRAQQYNCVFFDGINDLFVAAEHQALWDSFSYAGDVVLNGVPVNHIFVPRPQALDQLLGMDGQAFIDHAYATLLRRPPDPSGGAFYLRELAGGASKLKILLALAGSEEGRACGAQLTGLDELAQQSAAASPRPTLLRRLFRG